jgi:hypothetical protein
MREAMYKVRREEQRKLAKQRTAGKKLLMIPE